MPLSTPWGQHPPLVQGLGDSTQGGDTLGCQGIDHGPELDRMVVCIGLDGLHPC